MYGEWLRVTPAQLARAKGDLAWAFDLAEQAGDDEGEREPAVAERRSFGTDKTWHALEYLLERGGFPVSIIFGEETFVDDPEDPDADWGYGAPQYLTPERVRQAAVALAALTEEALLGGVEQAELEREQIYPMVWDRPDELSWAISYLPDIKAYFAAAATSGDALICWIG